MRKDNKIDLVLNGNNTKIWQGKQIESLYQSNMAAMPQGNNSRDTAEQNAEYARKFSEENKK